jgi:hypothetical protein
MKKRLAALAAGFALAAAVAGCASTGPAGPIDAKAVYEARCALCHPAWDPRDYAPSEWPAIMDEFSPLAGLTRAEHDAVLAYLVTEAAKR